MTQEALGAAAVMGRSYASDLERGARNPSLTARGRLATVLKIQPALLLEQLFLSDIRYIALDNESRAALAQW